MLLVCADPGHPPLTMTPRSVVQGPSGEPRLPPRGGPARVAKARRASFSCPHSSPVPTLCVTGCRWRAGEQEAAPDSRAGDRTALVHSRQALSLPSHLALRKQLLPVPLALGTSALLGCERRAGLDASRNGLCHFAQSARAVNRPCCCTPLSPAGGQRSSLAMAVPPVDGSVAQANGMTTRVTITLQVRKLLPAALARRWSLLFEWRAQSRASSRPDDAPRSPACCVSEIHGRQQGSGSDSGRGALSGGSSFFPRPAGGGEPVAARGRSRVNTTRARTSTSSEHHSEHQHASIGERVSGWGPWIPWCPQVLS
jgi:hypothetical protein